MAAVCLVLMAGTAGVLARFHGTQHLGKPGLRLVDLALTNELGKAVTTNSILLPERLLEFRSELQPVQRVELDMLPPDTIYGRRLYTSPEGGQVYVSGVLMGADRTSIHKPEYCLPGQGFQIVDRFQREILIDRPHRYRLPVTRLDAVREIRRPDGSTIRQGAVYVYWFLSDSRLSNDHLQRMWWLALDLVRTGELQRWAYLGVLAGCPTDQHDAAFARVEQFIQALVPEIQLTTGPPDDQVGSTPEAPTDHAAAAASGRRPPGR